LDLACFQVVIVLPLNFAPASVAVPVNALLPMPTKVITCDRPLVALFPNRFHTLRTRCHFPPVN